MDLPDETVRSWAERGFEASMDAHGYPVPAADLWNFTVSNILGEELSEEEWADLQAEPMPDAFSAAYNILMNRYLFRLVKLASKEED